MSVPNSRYFIKGNAPAKSLDEFIEFWAWLYPDGDQPDYTKMTKVKPKGPGEAMTLFKWKFPRFADFVSNSPNSPLRKYLAEAAMMKAPVDDESARRFLDRLSYGPIWRIFWLHCCLPEQFPIFDINVHRAMNYLETGGLGGMPRIQMEKSGATSTSFFHFTAGFAASRIRVSVAGKSTAHYGRSGRLSATKNGTENFCVEVPQNSSLSQYFVANCFTPATARPPV